MSADDARHRTGAADRGTPDLGAVSDAVAATTGPDADAAPAWEPSDVTPEPRSSIAPWALGLAILALVISMFVGWMLPLGAVAVIAAIVALRRLGESRPVAIWALALGAAAVAYSAGWLIWAIPQLFA